MSLWVNSDSNIQIAEKLNISQTTVRTHLKNIHEKFGAGSQIQMMTYACKENLLNGQFSPVCPNCRSYCFLSNT
ncbi:response regulator transcription factor [Mangrovibacterium sp.]|uniref:response regulator transcription factor n=1 Tax=Mangrovibacterium sp. TaxID=1961364 RepID=UPI0035638CAA